MGIRSNLPVSGVGKGFHRVRGCVDCRGCESVKRLYISCKKTVQIRPTGSPVGSGRAVVLSDKRDRNGDKYIIIEYGIYK